ncbi:C-type lectin 37Db-like [Anopheles bellator]|uniref:C-type lectin 37Db-like n=1 Tax=Anopheles bellator TaxID=139047 RepID=UPI002647075E|nr:C-type lectin 37Db-like [Anopheles bellator]
METRRLANIVALFAVCAFLGTLKASNEQTFGLYRQKSYYFGDAFALNWFKAWDFCRSRGMFLLSIRNQPELDAVVEYLEKGGVSKVTDHLQFWTSANDLGQEGQFFWASTGERMRYDRWTENEPNNGRQGECRFENCVVIQRNLNVDLKINYTFDDRTCDTPFMFMCETLYD